MAKKKTVEEYRQEIAASLEKIGNRGATKTQIAKSGKARIKLV